MKHSSTVILLISILLFLSGCASHQTVLKNDKGNTATCKAEGFGIISSMMAKDNFDRCVQDANAKGYK